MSEKQAGGEEMNGVQKISILGAGNVGATIAYTLTLFGTASEIVMVDINHDKAKGEALDIIQGTAYCPPVNIYAGDYSDIVNSDIVIVTVGSARKPGQSRIDLAQGNVNIIKSVMPQAMKYAPEAKYVVVSNPVDIITYTILKVTGLPENQVFGSGTLLDTARLRQMIAESVQINPKNVHAFLLGEHGDSAMIPWSLTTIAGMPIDIYTEQMRKSNPSYKGVDHTEILKNVHGASGEVINLKGATFYGVALCTRAICDAIMRNSNTAMTCSTMLHGEYGVSDVCVSIPVIIGSDGICGKITPDITAEEKQAFMKSANVMKDIISNLNI